MEKTKKLESRPKLYLAPMEGLGALPFRKAIASIGGFDEASTEFIRISSNAHIPSLVKLYNPSDTYPIPQIPQIMGGDPDLAAEMVVALIEKGAHRIDLNCGCPSKRVNGRGAGASLLKDPNHLYSVLKSMCKASTVPISAKLRSGYEDTSLFKENLLAAEEAGISLLILHPRTKKEGYTPPANWNLIKKAKELLQIPIVGSGDIKTVEDAKKMISLTGCDGVMVGRGAVANPWIFQMILASFKGDTYKKTESQLTTFLTIFMEEVSKRTSSEKSALNQMKQLTNFMLKNVSPFEEKRKSLLSLRDIPCAYYLEKLQKTLVAAFFEHTD